MPEDFAAEETTDPLIADARNFFKVELWGRTDRVWRMIYASNRLDWVQGVFAAQVRRRPGGRYTIRQGVRVLRKWPED